MFKTLACCFFTKSDDDDLNSSHSSVIQLPPMQECIVCMEQYDEKSCIFCSDLENSDQLTAQHSHCTECVRQHARATVTGVVGNFGTGLKCCSDSCNNVLLWGTIKGLLDENDVELLEKRLDSVALGSFNDIEYCIHCDFGAVYDEDRERIPFFECQKCAAKFCRTCRAPFADHEGKTCKQLDKKRKRNTKKLQKQEKLTAVKIRVCPNCQTQFIKEEGCNKMTCSVCGTTMCYLCRKAGIDYDHFQEGCSLRGTPDNSDESVFTRIKSFFKR